MVDDKLRILIVEDSQVTARMLRGMLETQSDFTVVGTAETGQEAVRRTTELHPDVILMDIHLPDVSGLDICKAIKEDPRTAMVPVLHMSATNISTPDQVRGLEGGADGYLVEPVPPDVLVATADTYTADEIAELEAKYCGRVEVLDRMATVSTSARLRLLQLRLGKRISEVRLIVDDECAAARCRHDPAQAFMDRAAGPGTGGKFDGEARSALGWIVQPERSAMRFNYAEAEGQANTGPLA